jgi:hypothetical protein
MARSLGTQLPGNLVELLSAPREGPALLLLSTDDDGWPRQAMLSLGEIVVLDAEHLRLALWPGSTTTHNLCARGQATLTTVMDGSGIAIRILAHRQQDLTPSGSQTLASFTADVREVTVAEVPYADLTSGVTFRLHDPDTVHNRWEQTRSALLG